MIYNFRIIYRKIECLDVENGLKLLRDDDQYIEASYLKMEHGVAVFYNELDNVIYTTKKFDSIERLKEEDK